MVEMQKDCRPLLRIHAYAALVRLTSRDGRSRTSSTAVPDTVLTPPSMESCAARHLHVQVQWRKCRKIVGRSCSS